jgi:hypothetical protein
MWRSGFSTTSRLSWWDIRVHGRDVECRNKHTQVKIHWDVISNAYVIKFFNWRWGWHGVATREGIRQPRNRGSIPVSDFVLFFSGVTILALGVHSASHLVGTGSLFHGRKSAGARKSPPSAEVEVEGSCNTVNSHIHGMQRDSFSFTF